MCPTQQPWRDGGAPVSKCDPVRLVVPPGCPPSARRVTDAQVEGGVRVSRLQTASLYWRTIRHLRPGQIAARFFQRLPRASLSSQPAPPARTAVGPWAVPISRPASILSPSRFRFLNREATLSFPGGWNDAALPKLWLYNLHYFDDLGSKLRPEHAMLALEVAERWIADNPPATGNGWEPYTLSLRIVNWLKSSLNGGTLKPHMRTSLAVQIRALEQRIEWHILANHLLANAKALVFAGHCHEGPEAARWLRKGLNILDRELGEQILADGGHFERSPMYHAIILEDVLDLINLAIAHPGIADSRVEVWRELAGRMLTWLAHMTHPDGDIAFFNDSALGVAPDLAMLRDYAGRLGIEPRPENARRVVDLKSTGYVRADVGPFALIFDAAPIGPDYQPGHAHADTLSFELSLAASRIFINSGVSTYEANARRAYERSSEAHNTLVVDGKNSSEVWSAFRVGDRARIVRRAIRDLDSGIEIEAAHDGYRRSGRDIIVNRTTHLGPDSFLVSDRIDGRFTSALSVFRLAPGLVAVRDEDGRAGRIEQDGRTLLLWQASEAARICRIEHALGFGRCSPADEMRFDLSEPSFKVQFQVPKT